MNVLQGLRLSGCCWAKFGWSLVSHWPWWHGQEGPVELRDALRLHDPLHGLAVHAAHVVHLRRRCAPLNVQPSAQESFIASTQQIRSGLPVSSAM